MIKSLIFQKPWTGSVVDTGLLLQNKFYEGLLTSRITLINLQIYLIEIRIQKIIISSDLKNVCEREEGLMNRYFRFTFIIITLKP